MEEMKSEGKERREIERGSGSVRMSKEYKGKRRERKEERKR